MSTIRFLLAVLILSPLFAGDPEGFGLWKQSDLNRRKEELARNVRPDRSARETLADYKSHRFRLLYRDGDGYPEQHDNEIDVVVVQSGEGTLLLGGRMINPETNPEANNGVGEWKGVRIEGGERHVLRQGDIAHIPAKIPHSFLVAKGQHFAYVLLKIPAR